MPAMIRDIEISAISDDDVIYEPPARSLVLSVVGGRALLRIHERNDDSTSEVAHVDVPATSLLYALQAAVHDNDAPAPPGVQ